VTSPWAPILSIPNPYGAPGSTLAQSPPFEELRARYEFDVGETIPFAIGVAHQGHAHRRRASCRTTRNRLHDYDVFSGVAKDAWSAQFLLENLTDARADLYTSSTNPS